MIDVVDFLSISPYYDAHLVRALQKRSDEVRLLAIDPYADWDLYHRMHVRRGPVRNLSGALRLRNSRLRRAVALLDYLGNLAMRRDARLVHVQWLPLEEFTRAGWIDLRWLRTLRVPVVLTIHNVAPHDAKHAGRRREMVALADAIICHTNAAREELIRDFGAERVHVIPHGPLFEEHAASAGEEEPGLVAAIGAIKPYKGLATLLDAWPHVLRAQPDARLLIAGAGDASGLRIGESVTLDARVLRDDEVASLHRRAAIIAFPYERITQSGALLTAMAFGKAIVASDLPGFAETLRDGESALLVPPGDPVALASAIVRLLNDATLRKRLGDAARGATVSWDAIAEQTLAVYESVLGGKKKKLL